MISKAGPPLAQLWRVQKVQKVQARQKLPPHLTRDRPPPSPKPPTKLKQSAGVPRIGGEGLRGGLHFCIFINVSTPNSQARKGALQTMKIASALKGLLRVREASAHCDIPCGIYDPISAKIAAQTVLKMVMRIEALAGEDVAAANSLSRYITVKEEHAALCKR